MEKQLIVNIDSILAEEAEQVLDKIGLDISMAVKILLKRLVREQGVSFLLSDNMSAKAKEVPSVMENKSNVNYPANNNVGSYQNEKGDMTKSRAILLFRNEGVHFNRNITFASKNRGAYNYWANPGFDMIEDDWYIILNDWKKRELHLFFVPANSLDASELTPRNDKNLIDLQIMYDDNTFNDNRSGVSFVKYLIKQIRY